MRWISYFGFTIETFEPLVRLNYVVVFRCFLFLFFFLMILFIAASLELY